MFYFIFNQKKLKIRELVILLIFDKNITNICYCKMNNNVNIKKEKKYRGFCNCCEGFQPKNSNSKLCRSCNGRHFDCCKNNTRLYGGKLGCPNEVEDIGDDFCADCTKYNPNGIDDNIYIGGCSNTYCGKGVTIAGDLYCEICIQQLIY